MWTTPESDRGSKPVVRVTRRYRFSASHRLHTLDLSDEENRDTYGKCNNPFGHGHDYVLDVTLRGELDQRLGRFITLDQFDEFVRRTILDPLDRRNLNAEVPEFAALVPTTENLAKVVAARLAAAWPLTFPGSAASPEKVKIWETKRNIFGVFVPSGGGEMQSAIEGNAVERLVEEWR
jgi:6-pyruvoyltetrahydropterin/6-carboxytetrahydropterin synthase